MFIKNTLSITASNVNLIFKLVAYVLIIMLIFFALFVAIVNPLIDELSATLEKNNSLTVNFDAVFNNEGQPTASISDFISDLWHDISLFFKSSVSDVIYTVLLLCLLLFVIKFISGISMIPCAKVVSVQMTTNFNDRFTSTLLTNFKSALLYSLISSVIFLIIDIPITALFIFLAALIIPSLGIFAVSLATFFLIVALAARAALVAQWIPRIVISGEKVGPALISALKDLPYSFKRHFVGALLIFGAAFILMMTTFLFTFFLSALIFVPLFIVIYLSFVLTVYCHKIGQNYYIDSATVIDVQNLKRTVEEIE